MVLFFSYPCAGNAEGPLPDVVSGWMPDSLDRAPDARGNLIRTDERDISARLPAWDYRHKSACHSHGEYTRHDDGDGFREVLVDTMEGGSSLLCSWLRSHRGRLQEKLPPHPSFSRFDRNVRRGKALIATLVR